MKRGMCAGAGRRSSRNRPELNQKNKTLKNENIFLKKQKERSPHNPKGVVGGGGVNFGIVLSEQSDTTDNGGSKQKSEKTKTKFKLCDAETTEEQKGINQKENISQPIQWPEAVFAYEM